MKAILVVDTRKLGECHGCPMRFENPYHKYRCFVDDCIEDTKGKCPLKPMPEKKDTVCGSSYDIIENRGYNMCIDEILGGDE